MQGQMIFSQKCSKNPYEHAPLRLSKKPAHPRRIPICTGAHSPSTDATVSAVDQVHGKGEGGGEREGEEKQIDGQMTHKKQFK